MKKINQIAASVLLSLFIPFALASTESDVNFLLNAKNPPPGVVFEIVEGKRTDLQWAIPATQTYIRKLRAKNPAMKFAIVSHGSEQFGLLTSEQSKQVATHKKVRSLVQNDDVPLHVCGTHASWYDKNEKDFPEYVDVVPAGPAKIRDYQRKGYALIVINQ